MESLTTIVTLPVYTLVNTSFSIILLGIYRLSFKFWFLLGRY